MQEAGFQGLPKVSYEELNQGVTALDDSPIDYGLVDLKDDQHVALVAHYIAKQVRRDKPEEERTVRRPDGKTEKEKERVEDQEGSIREEQEEWERRESGTLQPFKTYRTIYLGAGASIAYHIATRSPNLDPLDSLIIGSVQPWSGTRGPGVVAHPEHMITPMRQFLGDTSDSIDDVWLDRGKFSELVEAVLKKSAIGRITAPVTSLARSTTYDMIRIRVRGDDEPYYADHVVSGIGVGAHDPRGIPEEQIAGRESEVGAKRVMDMDLFTRVAGELAKGNTGRLRRDEVSHNPSEITVVLSGGNGAIDVAFDALNKGYKVHWIVGSTGPKFLPGFFNLAAYLPYLRTLATDRQLEKAGFAGSNLRERTAARNREIRRVEGLLKPLYESQEGGHEMFEGVVERFLDPSSRFEGIYFGRMQGSNVSTRDDGVSVAGFGDPVEGDLLVYGLGQDNKTFELLEGFIDDLVPMQDISGRFGEPGEATVGLSTFDDKLEIVGATAFRLAPQTAVTKERLQRAEGALWEQWKEVARVNGREVSIVPHSQVHTTLSDYADAFGTAGEAVALRRFSEAAADYDLFVESLTGKNLSWGQKRAVAGFQRTLAKARRMAKVNMTPVIESLPDNVLINDQLTPTRSQIEASTGFVPYDIGQRANFVSDDRTALAVHISARYPTLDSFWADLMVQKVVESRTQEIWGHAPNFRTLLPGVPSAERSVPPYGARFQKIWERYLTELEIEKRGM